MQKAFCLILSLCLTGCQKQAPQQKKPDFEWGGTVIREVKRAVNFRNGENIDFRSLYPDGDCASGGVSSVNAWNGRIWFIWNHGKLITFPNEKALKFQAYTKDCWAKRDKVNKTTVDSWSVAE